MATDDGDARIDTGRHRQHGVLGDLRVEVVGLRDLELGTAAELDSEYEPAAQHRHEDGDQDHRDGDRVPDLGLADEVVGQFAGVKVIAELGETCH